jgi:5-formyltetrahydrofolate cyclo-ligase
MPVQAIFHVKFIYQKYGANVLIIFVFPKYTFKINCIFASEFYRKIYGIRIVSKTYRPASDDMPKSKIEIRLEVKRLKSLITENEMLCRSAQVWTQIETNLHFMQATSVLFYWSMPGEVYTHDFIRRWSCEKTIILPVVDGNRLRLALFEGEQSLRRNATMNLYEPQGNDYPSPQTIDLAIVPGIAFDRSNHRIGRGRGYYDRLLPKLNTYNIGVCFDFQLFDSIYFEKHDIPMDEVMVND